MSPSTAPGNRARSVVGIARHDAQHRGRGVAGEVAFDVADAAVHDMVVRVTTCPLALTTKPVPLLALAALLPAGGGSVVWRGLRLAAAILVKSPALSIPLTLALGNSDWPMPQPRVRPKVRSKFGTVRPLVATIRLAF